MEKWKKKIIKEMFKQSMTKQKVSFYDIQLYFSNPNNSLELQSEFFNCLYRSWWYRFIVPVWGFCYERIYPRKKICKGLIGVKK